MTDTADRRQFIKAGASMAALGLVPPSLAHIPEPPAADRALNMSHDGLVLSPRDYAALLQRITADGATVADYYSQSGVVQQLELACAKLLGKEMAVFMPTGTLANHLAVRALAGADRRVLVQHESHFFNDTGDCAQTLSQLNLVPLAKGKATFTLADVEEVISRTASGRVASRVGVIAIETPVRRRSGEQFAMDDLRQVTSYARKQGIRLHLDGARMLLASAYTGTTPAEYAAMFDTVYISLWKGLNAASGAILAGPRALLETMYHTRRMFGGGLPQAWPYAAVALHYLDGFVDRFRAGVQVSETFIRDLETRGGVTAQRVPAGTNIFRLPIAGVDTVKMRTSLEARGISIAAPPAGAAMMSLNVNESWARRPASELATEFLRAMGKA
ncbi:MAG: beta-eliminating lyase-related protein [Gemmatimonadaceae bacterium]|nr:beta-eliminating lyase-related protein [Gemmatimonadaceae bacterium]